MEMPEEMRNEIDFMLGSIEECNTTLLPILLKHGINPDGGGLDEVKERKIK